MISRTFVIKNKSGLHVRPASILAGSLLDFEGSAVILFDGCEFSAKSVVRMLAAGIKTGNTIELRLDGPGEMETMERAGSLIETGLGD